MIPESLLGAQQTLQRIAGNLNTIVFVQTGTFLLSAILIGYVLCFHLGYGVIGLVYGIVVGTWVCNIFYWVILRKFVWDGMVIDEE